MLANEQLGAMVVAGREAKAAIKARRLGASSS
jgi:hypothetical protein